MIERILRFSVVNRFLVVMCAVGLAAYGIYSFFLLPIDAVPDVTNNQVQINTLIESLSPVEIEKQVTFPIENALSGIPGLESTRSISRNGFSQVTAIFDEGVDVYFARQQINEKLGEAHEDLPPHAEPSMGPVSTGLGEVYMWTLQYEEIDPEAIVNGKPGWQFDGSFLTPEGRFLHSELERAAYLRTVQDWLIHPQLKGIKGIADIDSIGGYVLQYHIQPDPHKMLALGITFRDITEAVERNNVSIGAGYIESRGESFLVRADARAKASDELGDIVVASRNGVPILIKDFSEIVIGKEMRTGSSSRDGHEVVTGTAMMLIGENSRTVAKEVDLKLQEIRGSLPNGITAETVLNRTKLIDGTIRTVITNLSEGALLVIAVLFLLLGNFRIACITALVIPFAMLLAVIGMVRSGISGNLMSLGAIDFGLIVDGAVIIAENCLRRLGNLREKMGRPLHLKERLSEVLSASKEMIQPTVYGQAIIIIVYVPILSLTGVEGKMFEPMAMTVIFALCSAFVLSLTLVPALIAIFVQGRGGEKENWAVKKSKNIYKPLLHQAICYPSVVVAIALSSILGAYLLFSSLGQEFVPTLDEHDLAVQAARGPSTSLTQATSMQLEVEKTLKDFDEVETVFSKTGTAEIATDPMPPDASDTFVILKPRHLWMDPHREKLELIESMESKLEELPGNHFEFTQPIQLRFNELIAGVQSDVAVKIYGDDFTLMQQTGETIASAIRDIDGAADVAVSQTDGLPVLEVIPRREVTSRLGLTMHDLLEVVQTSIGGKNAGVIYEGDRRFNLFVKLSDDLRADFETLRMLPVPLPDSGLFDQASSYVPLGEVADLKTVEGLNEIHRENGKRLVIVQSNVRGRDMGSFVDEAKGVIASSVMMPPGQWLEWGGQFEHLLSARDRLLIVVPVCFFLILLMLYSALGSFKDTFIVFTGVPLALTGGAVSLWLRGIPFSISAAVGLIALSGIAVLNGLVMVTCINQLIKKGEPCGQAIIEGALLRLRPVLMTALVASLGFVPMALATGSGAEVQRPLATVVIGGLISSTLLTLFVLPALYALFSRGKVFVPRMNKV